mmetsp:Transcript_38382/g.57472  ORF Transcript_38382/g.57472 Transcript_38382/m.57472 type:complete len:204 (-) Transcript_38382:90-701(-)
MPVHMCVTMMCAARSSHLHRCRVGPRGCLRTGPDGLSSGLCPSMGGVEGDVPLAAAIVVIVVGVPIFVIRDVPTRRQVVVVVLQTKDNLLDLVFVGRGGASRAFLFFFRRGFVAQGQRGVPHQTLLPPLLVFRRFQVRQLPGVLPRVLTALEAMRALVIGNILQLPVVHPLLAHEAVQGQDIFIARFRFWVHLIAEPRLRRGR